MSARADSDVHARGLRPARPIVLLLAATLLTACGGQDDSGGEGRGSESSGREGSRNASASTAPFGNESGPRTGQDSGDAVVLTDVRVDQHDGFDRIVLEFSGTGSPGWRVTYVDQAILEGSGEVVALSGSSTLAINASNTTWPAPDYYDGPARLEVGPGVPDLYVGGTFEGYTQVFAGVDHVDAPFRVFTRSDPPRLVIDVADSD